MTDARQHEFLELLEPVYPRLSRYALAITRNRDEAKDLVSEAVLVALERFHTIRHKDGFAGFLFRIVLRTHRRKHNRERIKSPFNKAIAEAIEDTGVSPDKAAEIAIVLSALDRLPAKMKQTVLLFDVADLSLEAVREIQGGTLSGVKSRLKRGHEALRQLLDTGDRIEIIHATEKKRADNILIESEEAYAL